MRRLSIKFKVPLIFVLIILITFLSSVIVLGYLSLRRFEYTNARILMKFAAESSYEILVKDTERLHEKINIWLKNESYIKTIFFVDHRFKILAHQDKSQMGKQLPGHIQLLIEQNTDRKTKYLIFNYTKDDLLLCMPIRIGKINLGYLLATMKRLNIIDVLKTTQNDIKLTFVVLFIMASIIIVISAYLLSKSIVDPILDIAGYINKYTHSNPLSIKPIPLKSSRRCWQIKHCENTQCKMYENHKKNCWEQYFNLRTMRKTNPMSLPCLDCEVFLWKDSDEIEKLKIFFNQLISSIQFHYQKNKLYSTSLEELIDERTKELKERSKDLMAETMKFSMIMENVVEGTLVSDLEGNIIQINSVARQLLDMKREDDGATCTWLVDVIPDMDLCNTIMKIISDTGSRKKKMIQEISHNKEGLEQFLVVKSTLVEDSKSNLQMVICLIEDITNKKLIDRFKNEFFHTISHDLKNPLTSVVGFLDLVLHGSGNEKLCEEHRRLLNLAFHSSEELQSMIKDLSDLVKLETAKITLNKISFPVQDFFYDLEDTFYPKLVAREITLETKTEPEMMMIFADYFRLKQVFSNLISNAIKMGESITIKLRAYEEEDNSILIVEDTGAGIPKDKLPFIFEKFTRLYTYTDKTEGLGLGLSIVKSLVNLHNGTITVDSEFGKGARFTVILPKA